MNGDRSEVLTAARGLDELAGITPTERSLLDRLAALEAIPKEGKTYRKTIIGAVALAVGGLLAGWTAHLVKEDPVSVVAIAGLGFGLLTAVVTGFNSSNTAEHAAKARAQQAYQQPPPGWHQ